MKYHSYEIDEELEGAIEVNSNPDVTTTNVLDERGNASTLSTNPTTITFPVHFEGELGRIRSVEFETLLSEPSFSPAPVSIPSQPDLSAYYAASSVTRDVGFSQEDRDDFHVVELTLTRVGTRASHGRVIEANPRLVDHEFGNDTSSVLVGVPAAASKAQWYNHEDGTRVRANPAETRTGESGDIDIYDLTDAPWYGPPPFDEEVPTLLYSIDYESDSAADCGVFDSRGEGEKNSSEDDSIQLWESVFDTMHDVDDATVFDNGLLRTYFAESLNAVVAESWDSGTETWTDEGLTNTSDWELFAVDITQIEMVDVRAQLEFEHPTDGLFALNVSLQCGWESLLVEIPGGETGPIPTGIEDWLSPIASTSSVDPMPSKGLVQRREVRR